MDARIDGKRETELGPSSLSLINISEPIGEPWNPDQFGSGATHSGVSVELYRIDAIVKSEGRNPNPKPGVRGVIGTAPTSASLNRLCFLLNNCDNPMASMLTITHPPEVDERAEVEQLVAARKAIIRKFLRCEHVWVREHQKNGSVHWHVFSETSVAEGRPGKVDWGLSDLISEFYTQWLVTRDLVTSEEVDRMMGVNMPVDRPFRCCRIEQMKTSAAGRYCGREGAKRFQKIAAEKWLGSAWWRGSRGIKCTPTGTATVSMASLNVATVEYYGGVHLVPRRYQHNLGLKVCARNDR